METVIILFAGLTLGLQLAFLVALGFLGYIAYQERKDRKKDSK